MCSRQSKTRDALLSTVCFMQDRTDDSQYATEWVQGQGATNNIYIYIYTYNTHIMQVEEWQHALEGGGEGEREGGRGRVGRDNGRRLLQKVGLSYNNCT